MKLHIGRWLIGDGRVIARLEPEEAFQKRPVSASSGTGLFLERRIVERCRNLAVADVLHAWRHGIIDAQDRKLVAVLDAALGDPVRVWPDEGGPS